ncbi:nucleotide exchange factor GrpE [bacterium SCSIO 12741]|nr:nucleotide exchange factor GrpE [bacterium SCSIO 12741]
MSKEEKNTSTNSTEEQIVNPENTSAEAAEEQTTETENTEVDELQKLTDQVQELNDRYVRLYSEFENFRRRTAREKLEMIQTAGEKVIGDLLPVMDDFARAIENSEKTDDIAAVKEGIQLVHQKFAHVMTQAGVTEIEAMGETFDMELHEAITKIPAPSEKEKGKVLDVVEKGYKIKDKVIRYPKVVVGE